MGYDARGIREGGSGHECLSPGSDCQSGRPRNSTEARRIKYRAVTLIDFRAAGALILTVDLTYPEEYALLARILPGPVCVIYISGGYSDTAGTFRHSGGR